MRTGVLCNEGRFFLLRKEFPVSLTGFGFAVCTWQICIVLKYTLFYFISNSTVCTYILQCVLCMKEQGVQKYYSFELYKIQKKCFPYDDKAGPYIDNFIFSDVYFYFIHCTESFSEVQIIPERAFLIALV